jgi:hypothetical protein
MGLEICIVRSHRSVCQRLPRPITTVQPVAPTQPVEIAAFY